MCEVHDRQESHRSFRDAPPSGNYAVHEYGLQEVERGDTTSTFSLYGTPLESTTYKFAKCLQKRFGIIEGVTDKSYITNSYHVHVTEEINAFDKLKFEAQFQHLSPAGDKLRGSAQYAAEPGGGAAGDAVHLR